jgi:signal transduction histidine kinase/ActR/RegA family two-component response regulator
MKIITATHLALAAAISAVMTFAVATLTFHTKLQGSIEDRQVIHSIVQGVAELQIRTEEYLDPHRFDLRPLHQWRVRDAEIQRALDTIQLSGQASQEMTQALIARHQEIRNLFNRLVRLRATSDYGNLARMQQQRLLGRLFIMFEEQLAAADDLRRATFAADTEALNHVMLIGAGVLSLLLGSVVLAVATVRNSMSAPLRRLLSATEALGEGNLDHRIGNAPANEIGIVSQAIDTMAARLQAVTSSRNELRRAQEALRRLNETLEQRVAKRTAELEQTHEQLRQAQKMEAVGQLTGGIAHDFNNLLAGIVGNLEMMRVQLARGRTSELQRYITSGLAVTGRAAALTHRLLAFSRRQTLDPRPTSIGTLIASMQELIGRTVGPTIQLSVMHPPGLWITLCDAPQLESALLNLAINARDAMPDGGQLAIGAYNIAVDGPDAGQPYLAPGEYVVITVSDTGCGMSPDVLARAFDPFFTTKPIGQGTGLGLSMVYGFVKQSGGHVRLDSKVDAGTRIWIYLPRYRGAVQEESATALPAMSHPIDPGMTLLIVDDEPEVRARAAEMLDVLGYRTLQAADGHEALRMLDSNPDVDLLVTDIGLPGGINGFQLAERARVLKAELKILFITGYAHTAASRAIALDPGTEILAKPFGIDALADKIRHLIEPAASC